MLTSGFAEDEIELEVLGWAGTETSSMEETISFLEAKEIAREALNRHSSTNMISSYRQNKKHGKRDLCKISCQSCSMDIEKLFWSKRHKRLIDRTFCFTCW